MTAFFPAAEDVEASAITALRGEAVFIAVLQALPATLERIFLRFAFQAAAAFSETFRGVVFANFGIQAGTNFFFFARDECQRECQQGKTEDPG